MTKNLTRSEAVVAFVETYLVVPEGAHVGRPVVLREWQRKDIRAIYDSPTRRAILSFGRKNGKTALAAMLVLTHLVGPEARRNATIFSAAQSRDQAAIVFSLASKMVRMSTKLNEIVTVRDSTKELVCSVTGVRYKALSAEASTAYGLSPVFVVHDELGQVRGPRSELYDALETAMGAQADPLSIVISTQAPTDSDLLSTLIDDAKTGADPRVKLFLYAADPDDDPWAPETWRKANPALDDFRSLKDMEETAAQAQRLPSFEASFRNLFLNQRVAAENHFLAPAVWALNAGEPDLSLFEDRPVYGGLDLSGVADMTALILGAEDDDGNVHVKPEFWVPKTGLAERAARDRAPYDLWARQGLLTPTPGASIDYSFIAHRLAEIAAQCDLRLIKFDRWRIDDLKRELDRIDCTVPLEPHGQGFRDMTPALERLEALALDGKLRHGGHPVLTWNAGNAIATMDPAGGRKLDKSKATGRIDGLVSLAMACSALAMGAPEEKPAVIPLVFGIGPSDWVEQP